MIGRVLVKSIQEVGNEILSRNWQNTVFAFFLTHFSPSLILTKPSAKQHYEIDIHNITTTTSLITIARLLFGRIVHSLRV